MTKDNKLDPDTARDILASSLIKYATNIINYYIYGKSPNPN